MSNINEKNLGPRWYVAHTYTGYENKVKANIEKIVENRGLQHLIFGVKIPMETVVEADSDTQKEIERKMFPGYVLIKMVMNDESWHIIRNTTGVTGFVGPGSAPVALTDEEVEYILENYKNILFYKIIYFFRFMIFNTFFIVLDFVNYFFLAYS